MRWTIARVSCCRGRSDVQPASGASREPGVLVTRDGDGHTGYNAGNACVDEAIESYLLDGTVPEDGLRC